MKPLKLNRKEKSNVVYVGTCRLGCSTGGTVTGNTAGSSGRM